MRWVKLLKRYSLVKRPTLRVVNPRIGTSIIPLDLDDDQIFFQYLTNKVHSISFQGTELQLTRMIEGISLKKGCSIRKMKTSIGRGKEKLMLLHLTLPNQTEIRRLIKIS